MRIHPEKDDSLLELPAIAAWGCNFRSVQSEGAQMNFERATNSRGRKSWRSNSGRFFIGLLGVFLLLMQASVARGQRLDGSLRVEVGDTSGASIVDAKVTVTSEA